MTAQLEQEPVQLFTPTMLANPYPLYQRLRSTCPVYHEPVENKWYLTRYADVAAGLRDPRLSSAQGPLLARKWPQPEVRGYFDGLAKSMFINDAPVHTRLRGLVNKAFTPRAVERMAPRIQRIVDDLLDAVAPRGRMDIIRDFAYPLPLIVIAEMLGIPQEDRERIKEWSLVLAVPVGAWPRYEELLVVNRSHRELMAYLVELVARRRREPRDDLLSTLIHAEEAGDRLTEAELYNNAMVVLVAGNETTTNLIGNGTLALMHHPEQMQLLIDAPALIPTAIEEMLRFDSPAQFTWRICKEEVVFSDVPVPQGALVIHLMGAANWDPEQFPDPDRLDVTRPDNHHLSFGAGPHYCPGAPLARLEAQIAFTTLLRRFPNLRLDGTPERRYHFNLRGLKTLPVAF